MFGNNDGAELRARLPEVATRRARRRAVRGRARDRRQAGPRGALEAAYPDADVLVFGHSHIPWDTTTPRGLRLLNPGSPTDRRRQPHCTYLTLTARDGALDDVRLHRLAPRVK